MLRLSRPRYPELLEDIAAKFEVRFVGTGLGRAVAKGLARDAVDVIRDEWGGMQLYIPRGASLNVEAKRRIVAERWNGRNTRELCRELNVSERRLRNLHKEARQIGYPSKG